MSTNRRIMINDTTYIEHVQGRGLTVQVCQTPVPYASNVQAVHLSKKELHHILSVMNTEVTHIPPLSDVYERAGDVELLRL